MSGWWARWSQWVWSRYMDHSPWWSYLKTTKAVVDRFGMVIASVFWNGVLLWRVRDVLNANDYLWGWVWLHLILGLARHSSRSLTNKHETIFHTVMHLKAILIWVWMQLISLYSFYSVQHYCISHKENGTKNFSTLIYLESIFDKVVTISLPINLDMLTHSNPNSTFINLAR